jgi:hypothetical protein
VKLDDRDEAIASSDPTVANLGNWKPKLNLSSNAVGSQGELISAGGVNTKPPVM